MWYFFARGNYHPMYSGEVNMSPKKLCAALVASLAFMSPAQAAPVLFNVVVVDSQDAVPSSAFDLPDVGSTGIVSFNLNGAALDADGDPNTGVNLDNPLPVADAGAAAAVFGSLALFADLDFPTVFGFPGGARFSNGAFAGIDISLTGPGCAGLACTLAGSFQVLVPGAAAPTTFTEVEALLNNPNAQGIFSFNGTVQGEFVSFRAESSPAVAPVPLPASGVMLLAALGLGGLYARRRSKAHPA
jgi:hypothetical protein